MQVSLLKVEIRYEQDLVLARRRARQIAQHLGFPAQDQVRIATALSELVRNVFQYTPGGRVEFLVTSGEPGTFVIRVIDRGPGINDLDKIMAGQYVSKTGMGVGLTGARKLVDLFSIESGPDGTHIEMTCHLPKRAPAVTRLTGGAIATALATEEPQNPFEEMQRQNQELLAALDEVQRQQVCLRDTESRLKEALERAEKASNAKTEFLANMSHEIRTPMNAVIGLATLLGRTPLNAKQETFVTTLRQSADSLLALVNDLLDISKIEDGKIELEIRPFRPSKVVAEVSEMMSQQAAEKNIALSAQGEPGAYDLFVGDPHRVYQILLNLVSNAVKFTASGGVTIMTREQAADGDLVNLVFSVVDTGIGIEPETLDRVFDKFVQADSSTTRRYGGSGLGLPIARSLTERMDGKLEVSSRAGEGSIFTVTLPVRKSPVETTPDPQVPATGRGQRGGRVLLVEDNAANILVASALLEGLGYEAVKAANGVEALARLAEQSFDMALMDVQMEGMDGYETTRRYREIERQSGAARLPIIAMTAFVMAGDREKCLAAGMDDYLAKPINIALFEDLLDKYSVAAAMENPPA